MKIQNFYVLFEEERDGGFCVSVPALPGCYSEGDTFEEASRNIREAIALYLEDEKIPKLDTNVKQFVIPLEVKI